MKRGGFFKTLVTTLCFSLASPAVATEYDRTWELRTPAEARELYGENVPANVFNDLSALMADFENHNTEGQHHKIEVGTGTFDGQGVVTDVYAKLDLVGAGMNNSILESPILMSWDDLNVSYLGFRGNDLEGNEAGIEATGNVSIKYCKFGGEGRQEYGKWKIIADPFEEMEISDCVFLEQFQEEDGVTVQSDQWEDKQPSGTASSFEIRNCLFRDLETALVLYDLVDAGIGDEVGGNVFYDCDTAIREESGGDQYAEGNTFVNTRGKQFGGKTYITDPEEILARQVVNEKGGNVYVSGLDHMMVPRGDYDDDEDVDALDIQTVVNEAIGIPVDGREWPDYNGNGKIEADDIQNTINRALGIPEGR